MQGGGAATSFMNPCISGDTMITVGYATDIEGNFDYWSRYVEISKVLRRLPNGDLDLNDNCQFVYGGDVVDRGPGDLRVLSDLVGLKRLHPDRVHFIMGNRDINKMRIPADLHSSSLRLNPKVYWIKSEGMESSSSCSDHDRPDTPAERLKWVSRTSHFSCATVSS